eukprot:g67066.t1
MQRARGRGRGGGRGRGKGRGNGRWMNAKPRAPAHKTLQDVPDELNDTISFCHPLLDTHLKVVQEEGMATWRFLLWPDVLLWAEPADQAGAETENKGNADESGQTQNQAQQHLATYRGHALLVASAVQADEKNEAVFTIESPEHFLKLQCPDGKVGKKWMRSLTELITSCKEDAIEVKRKLVDKEILWEVNPTSTEAQLRPNAKFTGLDFTIGKPQDHSRNSHLAIVNKTMYKENTRDPTPHGVLDRKLGTSDKKSTCETCKQTIDECIGHFGHIELALPCFHVGFFHECVKVLHATCRECARVMVPPGQREKLLARMMETQVSRRTKKASHEHVLEICKKIKRCPWCGTNVGKIKVTKGVFRITDELKSAEDAQDFQQLFATATECNSTLKDHIKYAKRDLNPMIVQDIFTRIPSNDCFLLNFNPALTRPEDLLINAIPVPPCGIRPSVMMGPTGSNEDDLSVKLSDIVFINRTIKQGIEDGAPTNILLLNWDFLQHQVSMYINSDLPGFPPLVGSKPVRALVQRLKGKGGRFRCNLSGKRVDFSSRTVISPDPNLAIEEVGIPKELAMILTFPERVTSFNIEKMRQLVRRGAGEHPGASAVIKRSSGVKYGLKFSSRDRTAEELELGDTVERHLADGDVVLFNRQPSLHRISIMSHRARILEGRTFRFNECCCSPYNADFDGDEMNVHVPQTQEARAEAVALMSVVRNLVTPRHGVPLVCAIQDFITTGFLLSRKEVFLTRDQFTQIVSFFDASETTIRMPPPAIIKPMRLWTGKQVFSLWFKPNNSPEHANVNLTIKAGNFEGSKKYFPRGSDEEGPPELCPRDGYVVIRNSELLCGNLCKKSLGGSNKGLFYYLIRNFTSEHAALGMTRLAKLSSRLAKLSSRWIGSRGFSIGIDDVMPSPRLLERKQQLISSTYRKCDGFIQQYKNKTLQSMAGNTDEETLEKLIR